MIYDLKNCLFVNFSRYDNQNIETRLARVYRSRTLIQFVTSRSQKQEEWYKKITRQSKQNVDLLDFYLEKGQRRVREIQFRYDVHENSAVDPHFDFLDWVNTLK